MENSDQMGQMPNQQPEMGGQINSMPPTPQSSDPDKKSTGSLVGILIILLIIIVGGWYFLRERSQKIPIFDEDTESSIESLEKQGTSDEVVDIEADLNATNLSDLDAELDSIDQELQAF